jgi:hypothetical protein
MIRQPILLLLSIAGLSLSISAPVQAHCDTMDGPVVQDAKAALETGDVEGVLKWIRPDDEAEIRALFAQVRTVRAQSGPAQALADRYFFESLVRIHRAGEGAPYTGLKPAGMVETVIAASDRALEQGRIDALVDQITAHIAEGIRQRFEKTLAASRDAEHNVSAGRAYVAAYVEFTHYVEGLHQAAAGTAHAHREPDAETSAHQTKENPHGH